MLHRLENKHKTKSQDKGEEKMNKWEEKKNNKNVLFTHL
jgi:hypothetical protein